MEVLEIKKGKFYWHDKYYLGIPDWEESVDLKVSLDLLLQRATFYADYWKDVNISFLDRRSFQVFEKFLASSGLDWHKYIVSNDYELNVNNQPGLQTLQLPTLTSVSNWVMANTYYDKSLSLKHLLRRIQSESGNEFSREQAGLLLPFLDHLISLQQEQRIVAYGFSERLDQLRKRDAPSLYASSLTAVVDEGDQNHPMYYYLCQQKQLFISLHIMSRESAWLLNNLKNSYAVSPLLVKESQKILEILLFFIPKFKNCKESLDQNLLDECRSLSEEDKMMNLVLQNEGILDNFGKHIEDLQVQGIGKKSMSERLPGDDIREYVTGVLLRCYRDVVNEGKITMDEHRAERKYVSEDTPSSLRSAYCKSAEKTLELINEAVKKLNLVMNSYLPSGGSPLGNITYWRVLFESSLINLRLDRICKKHGETIKLGVKLLADREENIHPGLLLDVETYSERLHGSISSLLTTGDSVLLEIVAIHKTTAEITYMLGDAFTTGGADMKYETSSGTSKENEQGIDFDFPWDKHNVPDYKRFKRSDFNDHLVSADICSVSICNPDDDQESDTEFS